MKQTKLICDACEKEITNRNDYYLMTIKSSDKQEAFALMPCDFDLCPDCHNKMLEFMCTLNKANQGR